MQSSQIIPADDKGNFMNFKLNKIKNLILYAFGCILLAGALSACGSQGLGPAAAGLGTETVEPAETATVLPETTPTSTPIPGTSGHIIFVSNRDGQMSLYMTTPDGVEPIHLTPLNSEVSDPCISPDGSRIAFVSTVDGNMDIYVLDLNSSNITRVTDAPEKDSAPSWSPDGNQLTFESFRDGNFEIYIANADGSAQTRLTDDPSGDTNPIWSPVANEIVFVSNRFGNSDLLLLSPNGTVSTLTTNSAPDSAPAWSPDGSTLAFKTYSGDLANLCLIGRDALNQHCLTSAPSEYGTPVWSPDGKSLAISAKQSDGYGINIFNVADASTMQLSSAGIEPRGDPSWSPEGVRVVSQALTGDNMELYTVVIPINEFLQITSIPAFDGEPIWSVR
jgi:Tol biopolymer transport system component